jgi:hypothetical protein
VTARATAAAVVAGALALAAAGCGEDKKQIPRDDARGLEVVLRTAERQSEAGACQTLVRNTIPSLERRVQALPARTDEDVVDSLTDGISNLRNLAVAECTSQERDETDTETTETESEPTTTESEPPPAPEPDTNTDPQTEPEPTPPDDGTEPPPDDGTDPPPDDGGNGSGGVIPPGQEKKLGKGKRK